MGKTETGHKDNSNSAKEAKQYSPVSGEPTQVKPANVLGDKNDTWPDIKPGSYPGNVRNTSGKETK